MVLAGVFLGSVVIFVTAILLASRPTRDQQRMLVRFVRLGKVTTLGLKSVSEADSSLLRAGRFTNGGHVERILTRLSVIHKVGPRLQQADSKMTLKKLLLTCFGAGMGGMFVAFIFLPVPGIAVLVGAGASWLPI